MLLFCPTMHFASGFFAWGVFAWVFLRIDRGLCLGISAYFCGFLQVRRKTSQFVTLKRCVFREISSNRTGCSQNCVRPVKIDTYGDGILRIHIRLRI